MAGELNGVAGQIFALVKDLGKLEETVKGLGESDGRLQAALSTLGAVQEAVDHLEERTSGLQAEVQALAPLRAGLNSLAGTVKQISERVQALAAEPADEPLVWNWSFDDGMDKAEAGEAWEILVKWVRTELQGAYGWVGPPADVFANASSGYGSVSGAPVTPPRIPPCWYRHREAVIELSWLCQEWMKIYRTSYGTPSRAGDWHDRYAPGVKRRVMAALAKCATDKGHQDDPWMTDANHPGAPRATDDDAALSQWITWDVGNRPDAPPAGPVAAS